jgi:hypothetical protein
MWSELPSLQWGYDLRKLHQADTQTCYLDVDIMEELWMNAYNHRSLNGR